MESNVRVALKEMMQRRYNTLKKEHNLLDIHPLRAGEAISSTEVQVMDAIHHYIKMNDQQVSIGVSAEDICGLSIRAKKFEKLAFFSYAII